MAKDKKIKAEPKPKTERPRKAQRRRNGVPSLNRNSNTARDKLFARGFANPHEHARTRRLMRKLQILGRPVNVIGE